MRKSMKFLMMGILIVSVFMLSTALATKKSYAVIKCNDLNYRYTINCIGMVTDFSEAANGKEGAIPNAAKKILVELTIQSIYGGFEWVPLNPFITDNLKHVYIDYKAIIQPSLGNSETTVKYLITPFPGTKSISIFEEGQSEDGKKAYRVFLQNVPVTDEL